MSWFVDAFAFLVKGGPVMIPLMACSIIAVAVMIERYLRFRTAAADTADLAHTVEDLLLSGRTDQAAAACESSRTSVGAVLAAGLRSRRLGAQQAERAMEEQALKEIACLQVRLGVLDTIITIAPLLGLLGTVTGMIRSFHVISTKQGMSTPTAITGGVAEALIATATGLAIAIASVIAYNYFNERVKRVVEAVEMHAAQLLRVLGDIEERRNEIKPLSA